MPISWGAFVGRQVRVAQCNYQTFSSGDSGSCRSDFEMLHIWAPLGFSSGMVFLLSVRFELVSREPNASLHRSAARPLQDLWPDRCPRAFFLPPGSLQSRCTFLRCAGAGVCTDCTGATLQCSVQPSTCNYQCKVHHGMCCLCGCTSLSTVLDAVCSMT